MEGGGGGELDSGGSDGINENNGSVFYPLDLSVYGFHLVGLVQSDEPDTGGWYGQGSQASGLQQAAIGSLPDLESANLLSGVDIVILASPNADDSGTTYNWGAFLYEKGSGLWLSLGGEPNARYTLEELRKYIKTTDFLKKLLQMWQKAIKISHDATTYTGGGGGGNSTYRGSIVLPERFCNVVSGSGPGTPWFSQVTSCYYRYTYLP